MRVSLSFISVMNIIFVSSAEKLIICSYKSANLNCSLHNHIDIKVVHFGRFSSFLFCDTNYGRCNGSIDAEVSVRARCENMTSCDVTNGKDMLSYGNCSPDFRPYLEIAYECKSNATNTINQWIDMTEEDSHAYLFGIGAGVVLIIILTTVICIKRHNRSKLKPDLNKNDKISNEPGTQDGGNGGDHEYDEISLEYDYAVYTTDNYGYNHLDFDLSNNVNQGKSFYDHSSKTSHHTHTKSSLYDHNKVMVEGYSTTSTSGRTAAKDDKEDKTINHINIYVNT